MKVTGITFNYLLPKPIKVGTVTIKGLIIETRLPEGFKYDIEDITKEVSQQMEKSVSYE